MRHNKKRTKKTKKKLTLPPFPTSHSYGKDFDYDSPLPLLTNYMLKQAKHRGQQAVILSQVLASNVRARFFVYFEFFVFFRFVFFFRSFFSFQKKKKLKKKQVTLGAEDITDCQVHRVNGQPIDSLRSLVRLLDGLKVEGEDGEKEEQEEEEKRKAGSSRSARGKKGAPPAAKKAVAADGGEAAAAGAAAAGGTVGGGGGSSRYARFELDYDQLVVLDVAAARAANEAILQQHSIAADRSPDLLAGSGGEGEGEEGGDKGEEEEKGAAEGAKKAAAAGSKKRRAATAAKEAPAKAKAAAAGANKKKK